MIIDLPNGGFVVDREIAAVIVDHDYTEITTRGGGSYSFRDAAGELARRAREAVLAVQTKEDEVHRLILGELSSVSRETAESEAQ